MTRCQVNSLDLFLVDAYQNATPEDKIKQKEKRMKNEKEFHQNFFMKVFGASTYEELIKKYE